MRFKTLILSFLFIIRFLEIVGQPINNAASYRAISGSKYIRFYYDNDFFTSTDGNYTQGINLELVHAAIEKFPLSKLLFSIKESEKKHGIAIEHLGYTPTSIRHEEIIYSDRPFAAALYLKTFKLSFDTTRNILVSSTINLGILGNAAGGEWMQKTIHRNLKNIEPLGWDNQVKNDAVINYEITFEKALFPLTDGFMFSSISKLNAGTFRDNIGTGFSVMAGRFSNPFFTAAPVTNNFQYKVYASTLVNLIGYDATLQGGMFSSDNSYTIANSDISRIVLSSEMGVTMQYKKVYLEYFQSIKSREFKTGEYHRWGGIRLGMLLK